MTLLWYAEELLKKVDHIAEQVASEGADLVLRDAKRLVPVETGKLKSEIDIKKSKFKDGGYVVEAQAPGNYDDFYASFVELGTPNKKGKRHGTTVARPYLRPALQRNKRRIFQMYQDRLK
jgi:HK97 gp10 family phage protein